MLYKLRSWGVIIVEAEPSCKVPVGEITAANAPVDTRVLEDRNLDEVYKSQLPALSD